MDNMESIYLKRIELLEIQLKMKIHELRIERECNQEALRYIFYLVAALGGRAEVDLQSLAKQKGQLKCRVHKEDGIVVLRITTEKKDTAKEEQEAVQMNIYDFPQYLPDRK